MGIARTRGLGRVQCWLFKENGGNEIDLTPDLTQPELPLIAGAYTKCSAQQAAKQIIFNSVSNTDPPTRVLRYRLTLKEHAIIPVADGDPNTVVTRQDIPGSHLLGAAAWHYLSQANHSPTDKAFRSTFLDGGLRFLTAYPELYDRDNYEENYQRTIRIPHSIRELKERDKTLVDFTEGPDNELKRKPKRRIGNRYARIYNKQLEATTVLTEFKLSPRSRAK